MRISGVARVWGQRGRKEEAGERGVLSQEALCVALQCGHMTRGASQDPENRVSPGVDPASPGVDPDVNHGPWLVGYDERTVPTQHVQNRGHGRGEDCTLCLIFLQISNCFKI